MLRFCSWVVLILPLLLSGCSESQAEVEHEHHHDHGPRPTFDDVVTLLRKQYRWATNAAAKDDAKHFLHELADFHESVELLPELAAETDLRKDEWDRVHAASKVLEAEVARLSESKSPPSAAERAAIDAAFEQLDEAVSKHSPSRHKSE